MADSFIGLLVDLFTMLPMEGHQELFTTLYTVYPRPVDAKRSLEMGQYGYNDWQQCLLDGALALSRRLSTAFFPKEPPMEDFEQQLAEASRGVHVFRRASSRSQSDGERVEILQFCRTICSVSPSHISFLQQLQKRLQNAGARLRFQLQLLIAQVSNCLHYNWPDRHHVGYGHHDLSESFLASDDMGSILQVLKDVWQFSLSPESVLCLLEDVQNQITPELSDIICDILISVLDCRTSFHPRIFAVMFNIDAHPEHILRAVTIASTSGSKQNSYQHALHRATNFTQCIEALGKSYNKHKASGADEETLLKLRAKAVDLLQQTRSMAGNTEKPAHLPYVYSSRSAGVDVQAVEQIVCDSGLQALADFLALIVVRTQPCILPSLEVMQKLANYYHSAIPGGQSRPLQLPPFKETIASLLERRKIDIKEIAADGDIRMVRHLLDDLKASFQFLGDEASFTTFEQDIAPHLQNSNRQGYRRMMMPWGMVYNGEDNEGYQEDSVMRYMQLMAAARGNQMGFYW